MSSGSAVAHHKSGPTIARDRRSHRTHLPVQKNPTLKGHKGENVALKHHVKDGVWEANHNGSKIKCLVLPNNDSFQVHVPSEYSLEIANSTNPKPVPLLSDIYSMSREDLLATLQVLMAGSRSLLHNEVDSIRTELEDIEQELKELIRIWTCLFESPELLEKVIPGYGYTEVEKAKLPLMSSPYVCVMTDEYLQEQKPSPQLIELAREQKEIVLAPSVVSQNLYTLIYPTFNLNSIRRSEVESLLSLKFNVLAFDRGIANTYERETHMILLLMHMFLYLDIIKEFNIPPENLYRFIGTIARRYRNVPFHCFYHAFNVTQTMFFFITTCNIKKVFGDSKLEIFAMLVSCLIHDADHPGLNNTFQKKYNSKLSRVHATSILENHHLNQGLCVLSQPDCDILCNLTEAQTTLFHVYVHRMVMATDLAFHKHILEEIAPMKEIIKKEFQKDKPQLTPDQILSVLAITMKCSDLSNEIRPCDIAFLWAARVTNEFFQQTDKERALGLPVTAFMDPSKINPAQEQENFINGLCKPLYGALQDIFPTVEPCLQQMMSNLAVWEKRRIDSKAPLCLGPSGWEEEEAVPNNPQQQPPPVVNPKQNKPAKKKWYK